jgi:DNA-binding PadR family transcriptional regulator
MKTQKNNVDSSHNFALVALLKTLHEEGHDSWSAFSELSLAILVDGYTIDELCNKFYSTYRVELPRDVAYTSLARLRKKGFIKYERKDGPYELTDEGKRKSTKSHDSAKTFKADFDLLIRDLEKFLSQKKIKIEHLEKEFIKFIDANLSFATDIITVGDASLKPRAQAEIAAYIISLDKRSSQLFKILQNIFFGRLYLQIFNNQTPIQQHTNFSGLEVYVDTNVLLGLLGLDDKQEKRSLVSLVNTLKNIEGVEIKVLDTTLAETKRVLLTAAEQANLIKDYRVNSLAWQLKSAGYDSVTINAFIENLSVKLEELGINEETIYEVASDKYLKKVQSLSEKYNQHKSSKAVEHDGEVLTHLAALKKGVHSGLLEKSKALFITTDNGLISDAKEEALREGKFPTSISTVELTCLIWLKDMSQKDLMEATLRQALMIYAREKMLESNLWNKFTERLSEARSKGKLDDSEIALLINSEQTKSLLFENGESAVDRVLDESYLEGLKNEQRKQQKKQRESENSISKINNKRKRISGRIATVTYIVFALLVSVIIIVTLLVGLGTIGLDGVGSIVSLLVLIPLLFVLFSGKVVNFEQVAKVRGRLIEGLTNKIEKLLDKLFY